MNIFRVPNILLLSIIIIFCQEKSIFSTSKIVGMVPAHNEATIIEQCLRALACYTDAIVFLDDYSDDDTLAIVKSLANELHIEKIITKDSWYRDESGDRTKMLEAGREIGGTHFIVVDADEMLTSHCKLNNTVRNMILSLQPGDQLVINFYHVWRSTKFYRTDRCKWTTVLKIIGLAFCDNKTCHFDPLFLHTYRIPTGLKGRTYFINSELDCLIHFQFAYWRNLLVKQAWYRCLERIRQPKRSGNDINDQYGPSKDERGIQLTPVPEAWFSEYSFFDPSAFSKPVSWREKQVLEWFEQYGKDHFADLDIWDINWGTFN